MKIVVVLFLLVLTLVDPLMIDAKESDIGGAAAGQTTTTADAKRLDLGGAEGKKAGEEFLRGGGEAKKAGDEFCDTACRDKKEPALNGICKESCALSLRAATVRIQGALCLGNCGELKKNGGPAATKPCEERCNKEYEAKAAEVTASCNAVCSKIGKDPVGIETCKMECTPPPAAAR